MTAYARQFAVGDASWMLVTAPTEEPLDLGDAKQYLRMTQSADDRTSDALLRVAREDAEDFMSCGLLTQTWRLSLSRFFNQMSLPRAWPLQNNALASPSTAPVITYYDSDDVLQTLSTNAYVVDTAARPGRIVRASAQTWPALSPDRTGARVFIQYVIGYTDPALVPERIKQGIRMRLAMYDADREGFEANHANARAAAEACWSDVVYWVPPWSTSPYHWESSC